MRDQLGIQRPLQHRLDQLAQHRALVGQPQPPGLIPRPLQQRVQQPVIHQLPQRRRRNLLMDLGGQADRVKFMIGDRGSNYTAAFDAVLAGAGIGTVLCNVRTSRMNAIAERWIGGCRRELLDRTLVWNQHHLRRILREYESHHNQHRPHRSLHGWPRTTSSSAAPRP